MNGKDKARRGKVRDETVFFIRSPCCASLLASPFPSTKEIKIMNTLASASLSPIII